MPQFYGKLILIAILLTFGLGACQQEIKNSKVEGIIKNSNSELVVLSEITPTEISNLDSTILDKEGRFMFEFNVEQTGFYVIHVGRNNFIRLQLDPNDQVKLSGDLNDGLTEYTVLGSEVSEMLSVYQRVKAKNEQEADSLGKLFLNKRHLEDFPIIRNQIDSIYRKLYEKQLYFTIDLIEQNSNELASILLINEYFGRNALFNETDHLEYFELLDSTLFSKYPENKHAQDHHQRVEKHIHKKRMADQARDRFSIGKTFPDIKIQDNNNELKALHETKGKLRLVYVWSALNAKSRKQNLGLVELYKDFKPKGFEVYGISLDNDISLWKNALRIDQIEWTSVCDGQGMNSPLVDLFALEEIPVNFLVDENWKIIDKDVELEELIKHLKNLK